MSSLLASTRAWWALVAGWALLAVANLYWFSYPSMDSWCYLAPAAAATGPFQLHTPLLGDWEGASHGWGLHWPGGPLLVSALLAWLPPGAFLHVAVLLLQWLGVALLTRHLARRLLDSALLANLAGVLILFDRAAFNIAWLQRHELLVLVAELGVLLALLPAPDGHTARRRAILFAGFWVMAASHPSSLGCGGLMLAFIGLLILLGAPVRWRDWGSMTAGYVCGLATLAAYFKADPLRWAAFQDHAQSGLQLTFGPGAQHFFAKSLVVYFPSMYRPLFTGWLLLAALALGAWLVLRTLRPLTREGLRRFVTRELPWLLILGFGLAQTALNLSTYNGFYMVLLVPFAALMLCRCLAAWAARPPHRLWIAAGLALLIGHAALWPARLGAWAGQGFINYRSALATAWETLPAARTVLIPEVLWEEALRRPRHTLLNTLPNNASTGRRHRYEAYVRRHLVPGDILVHDQLQSQPVALLADPTLTWEKIDQRGVSVARRARRLGFELDIYRLVSAEPPPP